MNELFISFFKVLFDYSDAVESPTLLSESIDELMDSARNMTAVLPDLLHTNPSSNWFQVVFIEFSI